MRRGTGPSETGARRAEDRHAATPPGAPERRMARTGSASCAGLEILDPGDAADAPPSPMLGDDPAMLVAAETPAGDVVHVSEDDAKRRDDLLCLACRTGVLAVKGPIKAHHFRHRSRAACVAGTETALHRLAKRILSEDPRLLAPRIVAALGLREKEVRPAFRLTLADIRVEAGETGLRPDLSARAEGAPIYIEIAVTHRIDEAKQARLAERGVSTMEIDLSRLPCAAPYARIAAAIREEAPRRWSYSRLAAAHVEAMRLAAEAAEARERSRVAAAADAALAAFATPPPEAAPPIPEALRARIGRLGLTRLIGASSDTHGAFIAPMATWRGLLINRFMLAACDAVAAHGALAYRPGPGYGRWESYPVEPFSHAEAVDWLTAEGLAKPDLVALEPRVAEAAQARRAGFETAAETVKRFLAEAEAAGALESGPDWGEGRCLRASDHLLGCVWREAELRRAAEIIDRAVHDGEIEPERVEAWLDGVAGPEIRGAHAGDRVAPRIKALSDVIRAMERMGAFRKGGLPNDLRQAAAKLGFGSQD